MAALGLLTGCAGALFTAPFGSEITLFVNPDFIPSHGGVAEVSALVVEPAGTLVSDGTVVQFVTTLGRIDREGRTRNGVARVNFVSDSRSGPAEIRAFSGDADAVTEVMVGNANVARILLRAEPSRITISNSTHVIATVFDNNGNPVANVPVFFRVQEDPFTEFFDRQGAVFTNTNGEAENVMRTRRSAEHPRSPALVIAEAPGPGGGGFIRSEALPIPIL
jgi:hypothetical protein